MPSSSPTLYDAVIVGAGPAGLSAAMVLGRARRRVLVLDSGRPRNAVSKHMHSYLTRGGISPMEFHALARNELSHYPYVRIQAAEALSVDREKGKTFRVKFSDRKEVRAKKVLLATGVADQLPSIPGFKELFGKSVFLCPYCDGWECRDRPIAVYGRGNRGPEFALTMTRWSRDIVLCTDGPMIASPEDLRHLRKFGIRTVQKPIARFEGKGRLERIVFEDGTFLKRSDVFFNVSKRQRSALASKLGCRFGRNGGILVGADQGTGIPGLYAAGDACEGLKMAVVAAAQGTVAGFSMNGALLNEEIRNA